MKVQEIYAGAVGNEYTMELKLGDVHYTVWIDIEGRLIELQESHGSKWRTLSITMAPSIIVEHIMANINRARAAIILQPKGEYITYETDEELAAAATGKRDH
jgi:hypothetical protein